MDAPLRGDYTSPTDIQMSISNLDAAVSRAINKHGVHIEVGIHVIKEEDRDPLIDKINKNSCL